MGRRIQWLSSLCVFIASAAPAAAADDYSFYVIIPTNQEMKDKYGRNLEDLVEYDQSPFNREGARLLNGGVVGHYPFAGIHIVESDPGYMQRHLLHISERLHLQIEPDFAGVALIDYEAWWAAWDHTQNQPSSGGPADRDKDFRDDWEDHVERYRPDLLTGKTGEQREQALRESYEEATCRFLVATLRACKLACPKARWGFYNYPKMLYNSPYTPSGVFGYGDLSHQASEINDRLAPLWEELDVTAPRLYTSRQTLPERVIPLRDNLPEHQYSFLASHVREGKRLAPHALCVPLVSAVYFAQYKELGGVMLSDRNTTMQFAVTRDAGADGAILWADAMTDEWAMKLGEYMNEMAIPVANELWESWYPGQGSSRPPSVSGAGAERGPTAGGEEAVPAAIPAHLRIRYSRSLESPNWGPVRQGSIRVSIPSHSPAATASNPVHRGGRIVSRRAVGTGDSPPEHRPALTDDPESDGE